MLRGLFGWLGAEVVAINSRSPLILHKAEEYGQSRELTVREVMAVATMTAMKSVSAGASSGLVYIVVCLFFDGPEWDLLTNLGIVVMVAMTTFCIQTWFDLDEMRDGLRSYRSAETYAPPVPSGAPQLTAPDIVVKPYKGDPYRIGRGGGPGESAPALPAPQQQRAITEPVVAAALQASLENQGTWSRRTITGIVLPSGGTITRGMWRKLTHMLQDILIPQPDGSHRLPPDVSTFEELCARYLPTLSVDGQSKTLPIARPPACPPARPGPGPPAHPENGGLRIPDLGVGPSQQRAEQKSRRDLFITYGCDAREIIKFREQKKKED